LNHFIKKIEYNCINEPFAGYDIFLKVVLKAEGGKKEEDNG